MIYLISYDLYRPEQDYEGLIEDIKGIGPWIKPLISQWFVQTSLTAQQIYERLSKYLDSNDKILINELPANRYGFMTQNIWDWISSH